MEAPDKIYITEYDITSLPEEERLSDYWYKTKVDDNSIEYIRKDKLLEWAKERLNANMNKAKSRGCLHTIAANEDKELIEKLNSV